MDEFDSNDFLLNQARNAFERDKIITQVISDFADHQRKRDQEQRKQKAAFFKIVCFSFCAVIVGSLAVIIIIATKQDMGWEELGVALASVGSLISADWVVVFLDCVILLIFVCIGNSIANRIYEKKDAKRNARIRAREELNERKKQILEDSYKKKRQRKLEEKASSNNESEKIEKEELSNTEVKVEENNSVDKPKKTQVKNKKTKEKVVDEKE